MLSRELWVSGELCVLRKVRVCLETGFFTSLKALSYIHIASRGHSLLLRLLKCKKEDQRPDFQHEQNPSNNLDLIFTPFY